MSGRVVRIFISPSAGESMQEVERVRAIAGAGLEGDRYTTGLGAYSKSKRQAVRHVTLISIEAIAEANAQLAKPFDPSETRRNIVVKGIDLNSLVGKRFRVGEVEMQGLERSDPCKRPSKLAGKPDFESAFHNKGGILAEILSSGIIGVGDEIIPQ